MSIKIIASSTDRSIYSYAYEYYPADKCPRCAARTVKVVDTYATGVQRLECKRCGTSWLYDPSANTKPSAPTAAPTKSAAPASPGRLGVRPTEAKARESVQPVPDAELIRRGRLCPSCGHLGARREAGRAMCWRCRHVWAIDPSSTPAKPEKEINMDIPRKCVACGALTARVVEALPDDRERRKCGSCGREQVDFSLAIKELRAKGHSLAAARKILRDARESASRALFS